MVKPSILLTRSFPALVQERAARDYHATFNHSDTLWQGAELAERAADMDGLLISSGNQFTEEVIDQLPASIRIIATYSSGFEHIDLKAARFRGINVTNTPGVMAEATADIALLLLLAAARRAREGFELIGSGKWKGWAPNQLLGVNPADKKLGIVGNGCIGRALARRVKAIGMKVHYHNRNRLPSSLENGAVYHDTLESLLSISSFLSLNCDLTPETKGMLNKKNIGLLPKGVIIVNTSRGEVVDDEAIISGLKSGHIGAVGLDVYKNEPNLDSRYLTLPNAFLLPHLGSSTSETRNEMGFLALDNLDAFFRGCTPPHLLV